MAGSSMSALAPSIVAISIALWAPITVGSALTVLMGASGQVHDAHHIDKAADRAGVAAKHHPHVVLD